MKKDIDKKVKDYLERAEKISIIITKAGTNDYEAYLARVIQIAKMIQREEHK